MISRMKILEKVYPIVLSILAIFIVFHDFILRFDSFNPPEEYPEMGTLALLILSGYVIHLLYQREVRKNIIEMEKLKQSEQSYEEMLDETFKHIGALNVQIDYIKSIFSDIKKYPENKKDFKLLQDYLATKVLGIVNTEFVVFRIVDTDSTNTLSEYALGRNGVAVPEAKISNADLLAGNTLADLLCFKSDERNLKIKVFCVLSEVKMSEDQKIFINAITNQLEMLFLIFTSHYYKDSHIKSNEL